jgi:ParB/RepB/Spo0J family partition protein
MPRKPVEETEVIHSEEEDYTANDVDAPKVDHREVRAEAGAEPPATLVDVIAGIDLSKAIDGQDPNGKRAGVLRELVDTVHGVSGLRPPRDERESQNFSLSRWVARLAAERASGPRHDGPVSLLDRLGDMNVAEALDGHDPRGATAGALRQVVDSLQAIRGLRAPNDDREARNASHSRRAAAFFKTRARARLQLRRGGAQQTAAREIKHIPIGSIDTRKIENARLYEDEEAFAGLCGSMDAQGLQQPVVVVEDELRPGRYVLAAGFRRVRAAHQLGFATVPATVYPAGVSEEDIYLLNVSENTSRRGLSDYELAARIVLMRDRFGTAPCEFARRTGVSENTVEVLAWLFERLPVDVLGDWKNAHPDLTRKTLQRLAQMDHPSASEYWAAWKVRLATAHNVPAHPGGRRKQFRRDGSSVRPAEGVLSRLWLAAKHVEHTHLPREPEGVRALLINVIEFALGHLSEVPGLFDPRRAAVGRSARRRPRREQTGDNELKLPAPVQPIPSSR